MATKKVLIIEDDAAIREALQLALEMKGYEAMTASNGREAIDRLKDEPNPGVILLDLMMPGMNGWQFLDFQQSRPEFADIPVIVCSAFYESARTVNSKAFLPKPVELKALLHTVEALTA